MRKNQLFLVACFVSVSFFALSSFVDSNAWAGTKCEKKSTDNNWCILFQDFNFKTSFGYTNTTTNLETNGNPSLGANIEATETYGSWVGFSNKKIISQILKHGYGYPENKRQGFWWDFFIDPIEINAGIKFSRQLKVQGQNLTRELTDRTSYNVEVVYNLPLENILWID